MRQYLNQQFYMYKRSISLDKNKSFFLFGQRGSGKSTLLQQRFGHESLLIDLLDSKTYLLLSQSPWKLSEFVGGRNREQHLVIIDEVQKIPLLLDEVHKLIESESVVFALSGSSSRELKKEGANLLAGRASNYKLYPLSSNELGQDFDLDSVLQWGALPSVAVEKELSVREEYLYSYVSTYLREEIILEQVVRQIEPFRRFLEVAAQSNAKLLNYQNLARDIGISSVSVKNYFDILCDTLIGFILPAYHSSIRKRQRSSPKFYFFDTGIVRTLQNKVQLPVAHQTYEYGDLFESFIVNEIVRQNEYKRSRYQLSHFREDNTVEVDLIVERPGMSTALIEIKSKKDITEGDVSTLNRIAASFGNCEALCFSRDPVRKKIGRTLCVPWEEGLSEL